MKSGELIKVLGSTSVRSVMNLLNVSDTRIVIIVSEDDLLVGTVTDGDVRRGLLNGITLDDPVEKLTHICPIFAHVQDPDQALIELSGKHKISQIVILDDYNKVVDLKIIDHSSLNDCEHPVVLMAGGLGKRLRPLTKSIPKPLLAVGNQPIVQTIIQQFASYGFKKIWLSVNYKADMIKKFIGDGSDLGVTINYIDENERLGTAGALGLIGSKLNKPFIVMNADVLTNVNFMAMLNYHLKIGATGTICVREFDFQVPYGVVRRDSHRIFTIDEKPVQKFDVCAGIYVFNPDVLSYIKTSQYLDMPDLLRTLISHNKNISAFPIGEYWRDVGKISHYEQANLEYESIFGS